VRVRVVKNKISPPFKEAEFDIIYGEGISKEGSILDLAVDHGIVVKSGSWFSYGDIRLGQGRENARDFLKTNIQVCAEIEQKVLEKVGMTRQLKNEDESEVKQ
jgi:recombination protein RecA